MVQSSSISSSDIFLSVSGVSMGSSISWHSSATSTWQSVPSIPSGFCFVIRSSGSLFLSRFFNLRFVYRIRVRFRSRSRVRKLFPSDLFFSPGYNSMKILRKYLSIGEVYRTVKHVNIVG